MFSTNSDIDIDEVHAASRGRLALHKGEGRVRLGLRQVALNGFAKWHSSARRPLTLFLSPSVKGEATKRPSLIIHCARFKDNQPEISNGNVGQDT